MSEVVEFDIVGEDSNKNLSTPKNDIEKSFRLVVLAYLSDHSAFLIIQF